MANRRGFIFGFAAFLAAPAIVRASNMMPVSVLGLENQPDFWLRPHLSENWDVPKWQAGYWVRGEIPRYEEVESWNVPRLVKNNPKTFVLQSDYRTTRLMQNDSRSSEELEVIEDRRHSLRHARLWADHVPNGRLPREVTRAARDAA